MFFSKPKKVVVSWSGGKDCTLALHKLKQDPNNFEVVGLLSTVVSDTDVIGMHNVPFTLIQKQAEAIGLPVFKVEYPASNDAEQYEKNMAITLDELKQIGVIGVVFGDIFLQDLRKKREEKLTKKEMQAFFPLWGSDTETLPNEFLSLGFKSIITNVDTNFINNEWLGKDFDKDFLVSLPPTVDKCGEKGEFHSFAYMGPVFNNQTITFELGDISSLDNEKRYHTITIKPKLNALEQTI